MVHLSHSPFLWTLIIISVIKGLHCVCKELTSCYCYLGEKALSRILLRVRTQKLNFLFLNRNICCGYSDFIWQFLTPNIDIIPNPKTGCIFPIFVSIFPIKFFFFFRVCSFQSRPRHCAIGPFTGSWSKLDVCRDRIGALPILQVSKLCNNFQLKNIFLPLLKPDVFIFLPTIGLLVV